MTTIIKLVVASILALLMSSCNFGVKGNGKVKTVQRTLKGTYDEIEVSQGLDLYLTQADNESISVQADENLHDIIITKIEGRVLKIYTDGNISFSKSQKVMVNFKDVSRISASSGSDVFSTNTFNMQSIKLETTSGSDLTLDINAQSITCHTSSGSELTLSGTTVNFTAEASSGSDINATNLKAESTHAEASSGSDISVNTTKELYADADSGGDIKYSGNPSKVKKTDNVSGSINQD